VGVAARRPYAEFQQGQMPAQDPLLAVVNQGIK
jgi:hypothetical protein